MATNRLGHFSELACKAHVAADSKGRVIVDVAVTAGDRNEGNELFDQVDRITCRSGRPPTMVTADAGCAYGKVMGLLRAVA